MAMVEISEEEYARHKRVLDTVTKMARHPKAAKLLEQANKELDPNAATPIADADAKVREPVSALEKKIDEFIASQAENSKKADKDAKESALKEKWEAGRAELKKDRWNDEGIKALEDFMEKHGIVDHQIGLAAFEKIHPPPAPAMPVNTGSWDWGQGENPDKTVDKLVETIGGKGNPDPIVDRMAYNALSEFRQSMGVRR